MFDFLFRKQKLRRELEIVREAIIAKKAEVEASETECRKAWGKKWSYLQMQRRRPGGGDVGVVPSSHDGQAEVFEMRRQHQLRELKQKEQELSELKARESSLLGELGENPSTLPEASSEKR